LKTKFGYEMDREFSKRAERRVEEPTDIGSMIKEKLDNTNVLREE
jgi:hypothetical protein